MSKFKGRHLEPEKIQEAMPPEEILALYPLKPPVSLRMAEMVFDMTLGESEEEGDIEQFRRGLEVELEHGTAAGDADVTHDDPIKTAKIALAHLREIPDYYTRLDAMEAEAKGGKAREWKGCHR